MAAGSNSFDRLLAETVTEFLSCSLKQIHLRCFTPFQLKMAFDSVLER
jgi:hypothetical protein